MTQVARGICLLRCERGEVHPHNASGATLTERLLPETT